MTQHCHTRLRRIIGSTAIVSAVAVGALGCSSSTSTSPSQTSVTTPEEVTTSAATVAAGLTQIQGIAADIAATAGTDKAAAEAADEKIEPIWMTIEGTVKANDPDTYLAFEDAFSALSTASSTGDAAKAADGSSRVASNVSSYLATYPG